MYGGWTVTMEETTKYCPISGTNCRGDRCACWKYEDCGLIHTAPDPYDIVEAVNDLTEAVKGVQKSIVHMPVL